MTQRTPVESPVENRLHEESELASALVELSATLVDVFGAEFSILDGDSGDLLHTAAAHGGLDWLVRAELCRTVARRQEPELVEDDEPLVSLAIPTMAWRSQGRGAGHVFEPPGRAGSNRGPLWRAGWG